MMLSILSFTYHVILKLLFVLPPKIADVFPGRRDVLLAALLSYTHKTFNIIWIYIYDSQKDLICVPFNKGIGRYIHLFYYKYSLLDTPPFVSVFRQSTHLLMRYLSIFYAYIIYITSSAHIYVLLLNWTKWIPRMASYYVLHSLMNSVLTKAWPFILINFTENL